VKKFRSEGPISYANYQFAYCDWIHLEDSKELKTVYGDGFLPFSGDPKDPRHLFYMARSLRVNLEHFSVDKKRRYDHREWTDFGLIRSIQKKEAFMALHGESAIEKAQKWMHPRFGEKALSPDRLAYILAKPYLSHILTWSRKDRLTAFALIVRGDWGAHYWYVFYENGGGEKSAPGHGYLADFLEWARSEELPHAYIGTAYGLKSRYKSRGLKGIEFWDGNSWNTGKEKLKQRQEADELRG